MFNENILNDIYFGTDVNEHKNISKEHALIVNEEGIYRITAFGDGKVWVSLDQPTVLRQGMVISFGWN